jgi:hypothetical protein
MNVKTTSRNQLAVILASAAALLACGGHNPTATPASAPSANRIDEFEWPAATDLSGVPEPAGATVVMDSAHKIRYLNLNGKRPLNCRDGTKANEDMLITVYDGGNTFGKPVGSGWYVAELEAGVCGVPKAGLYGCKFDVVGRLTECGAAAFRGVPDDIVITRASAGPGTK